MHGLLTALRAILDQEKPEPEFHRRLIEALEKNVDFMLGVLSGGAEENADFATMGIAVESMIGNEDPGTDNVVISDDHSLVLACAWLNIKVNCL